MRLITGALFALGAAVAAGREQAPAGTAFASGPLVTADENAPSITVRERWFVDDPADSLYRAARETMNKGDFRRAATMFRQVVDRYPKSDYVADALYYQAFSLARLGTERELRQALTVLEEQQRRFPDAASRGDAGALATRIRGALAQRGDPEAVRRLIEDAKGDLDTANPSADAEKVNRDAEKVGRDAEKMSRDAEKMSGGVDRGNRGAKSRLNSSGAPCSNDEDEDSDMRIAALNALLQMDSDRAMPILKQVLARRDPCSEVLRRKAVFLVAQKQTAESADLLISAARNDPDPEVRQQAVFWLSEVRSDQIGRAHV